MNTKRFYICTIVLSVLLAAAAVMATTPEKESDTASKERVGQFHTVALAGLFDEEKYTREEIETAIVMTRGKDSKNPVATSKRYLAAVVDAFLKYSERYKAPSMLFVGMALKESEFKHTAVGSRGELGILQVGKQGRRACAPECGEFSDNPDVQICHGFCWFNKIRNETCDGTLRQALNGYASGKCEPPIAWTNTRKAVERRYRTWGWLHLKLGREM